MGKLASPATTTCGARDLSDDSYNSFVIRTRERLYKRFATFSALGYIPALYVSSYAADIKAEFLAAFRDPVERQHYTCHNCLTWLERYGALVFIDPATGQAKSAFMAAEDALAAGCSRDFIKAISRIEIQVSKFAVSGVFDGEPGRDWGKRGTSGTRRMAVPGPTSGCSRLRASTSPRRQTLPRRSATTWRSQSSATSDLI